MPAPLFHVVLVEPEIPNNTGNIGRTCVATACALHLVHPLGFEVSEKACRRAGLDYWPRLDVTHHESWKHYEVARPPRKPGAWFLTTKAPRTLYDAPFQRGDTLVFGKETRGLDESILAAHPDQLLALPMVPQERSLNLATAVCAVVYEGVRQLVANQAVRLDTHGRLVLPTSVEDGE
mgnify:CR=1 FL=1